jgi:hypothetical protein
VVLCACGAQPSCRGSGSASAPCADLLFGGRLYDEWRDVDPPDALQEVGNATYPACTGKGTCNDDDLGGFGATDVWLLDGVDPTRAVLGIREGTHDYVVFVRSGVDPSSLPLGSGR